MWIKNEEKKIQATSLFDKSESIERKLFKQAENALQNKAIMTWFAQERVNGTLKSEAIIRNQAQQLKQRPDLQKGINNLEKKFKTSEGLLSRFKKRYDIRKVVSEESRSTDSQAAKDYPKKLRALIEEGDYSPELIYNCGKTGSY